ncbi:MAG: tRNA pseudouridine(38-40) synthase TruA [Clostridia bacterium]|nr:tRNA pseudouridine(38-40) synthase TruA [Clostridia bacterium]
MKIKLILNYDGSNYCGWQVQKNAPSIQYTLQDAVENVFGKRYSVTGCSRTDSGVHARCFCCTVDTAKDIINIPVCKIPLALNRYLPDDIAVLSAEFVDDDFHPRYDVKYKEYRYLIWNSPVRNVFLNNKAFIYPIPLNEEVMDVAAKKFVGKYDFSAFMSAGSSVEDTVREIKYFEVKRDGDKVIVTVAADGFLYNMVRILTGTLIEVSTGKIDVEDIPKIIESKDRKNAGFTVPPQGLYLNKVVY